jgi:VWFA-related protein
MIQYRQHLLCGALLLCIASQQKAAGQGTPLPPPTKPVQIYLTASDKHGSPITLSQSDLSVFIDKKPAQVTAMRSAKEDKLLFALLVDTSKSDATKAKEIKEAAILLFQGLSTGDNQGYLVLFDIGIKMSKKPLQPSTVQKVLDSLKFGGGTALFDAIGDTCTQILSRLGNPDTPRRAIFLISDGDDNSSQIRLEKAEETAEKEGVAIFSLEIVSTGGNGEHFLKEASHNTGGQTIIARKLEEGVAPLLNTIHGQWVLDVVPPQYPDQKRHSLAVKTSRKDVHLSAPANIFLH